MKGGHAVVLGLLSPLAAPASLAAQTVPPAAQPGEPLAEATCREVLAALDGAFESGDARAYLDRFAPEQQWLHAVHRRAIELRLAGTPPPRRASELVAPPRCVGPRTVLMVG